MNGCTRKLMVLVSTSRMARLYVGSSFGNNGGGSKKYVVCKEDEGDYEKGTWHAYLGKYQK